MVQIPDKASFDHHNKLQNELWQNEGHYAASASCLLKSLIHDRNKILPAGQAQLNNQRKRHKIHHNC